MTPHAFTRLRRCLSTALAAVVALLPAVARAQSTTTFAVERLVVGLAILDDWQLPQDLFPWQVRTNYDRLLTDRDVETAVETLPMPFSVRRWRAASARAGVAPAA